MDNRQTIKSLLFGSNMDNRQTMKSFFFGSKRTSHQALTSMIPVVLLWGIVEMVYLVVVLRFFHLNTSAIILNGILAAVLVPLFRSIKRGR